MRLKVQIKETKRERREMTQEEQLLHHYSQKEGTTTSPAYEYLSGIGYVPYSVQVDGTAEFLTETIRDASDEEYYMFLVAQLPMRYTIGDDAQLKYFLEKQLGKILIPEIIP